MEFMCVSWGHHNKIPQTAAENNGILLSQSSRNQRSEIKVSARWTFSEGLKESLSPSFCWLLGILGVHWHIDASLHFPWLHGVLCVQLLCVSCPLNKNTNYIGFKDHLYVI